MSLLLQALQKAAKNREAGAAPIEEPVPPPTLQPPAAILPPAFALDAKGDTRPREPELTLAEEDLFEPDEPLPEETGQRFEPFGASAAPSPADAAAILRANETPSASWVDWIRDRPVWALGIGAGVFLVFYGGYVYLQIAHPRILRGDFMNQPLASKVPAAPARPISEPPKSQTIQPDPSSPPASAKEPTPSPVTATTTPAPAPQTAQPTVDTKPPRVASLPPAKPTQSTPPAADPATSIVTPRAPVKPERQVPPSVPRVLAALPKTPQTEAVAETPEYPDQTVRPAAIAPTRRTRKGSAAPVVSVPALEHEISSTPGDPRSATVAPMVRDAYQALQAGRLDQAESLYRNALQAEAQNVDALLGLAALAVQRGQAQQAIGFYEHALEVEPRNPVALAGLIALIGQADPQMSETRLKQLIAREPSGFLFYSLANLYASQEQWPAAQSAYFQAYQLQPDNPDYAYNLAVGLEHLNQPKLALTYYRKAMELSFQKGRANFDQKRVIERIGQLSARVD